MRKQGVRLLEWNELETEAREFAQSYFQREVDPLLTPISIDPAHPFPRLPNKALCLALLLRPKRRSSGPQVLGVVTVPRALSRFVRLPAADGKFDYLLLQDLIAQNLAGMYRAAHVGLVTPMRDGMNLVAKEYVAAQDPDDPGVLILSRFAGAADEFREALLVNPYDPDAVGAAIARAVAMPRDERKARHQELYAALLRNDISTWGDTFLKALGPQERRHGLRQRSAAI